MSCIVTAAHGLRQHQLEDDETCAESASRTAFTRRRQDERVCPLCGVYRGVSGCLPLAADREFPNDEVVRTSCLLYVALVWDIFLTFVDATFFSGFTDSRFIKLRCAIAYALKHVFFFDNAFVYILFHSQRQLLHVATGTLSE